MSDDEITEATVVSRRLDARFRNVRGTVLVAGPDQAFELTDTAAFIWKQIDGSNTVTDIGRLLAKEYDVAEDVTVDDVLELVRELHGARLLSIERR